MSTSRRRLLKFLSIYLLSIGVLLSCSQVSGISDNSVNNPDAPSSKLIISAAASLTDVMEALQPIYQAQQPVAKSAYNFGSSGSLQQQIEQGAPVDVFISAAPKQMDALEQKGLILAETRQNLLTNQVVLIVPGNSTNIQSFNDLTQNKVGKIAIADPDSAPAGKYAKEVLDTLKIFDQVQSNIVYAKDVRQVLSYVETGNVDAGIVYRTDAANSSKVTVVTAAPEGSHTPIVYPLAVIQDSTNPEASQEFITFLSSPEAKVVFEQFGFKLSNQ
ncbi:MAG: molybdate ABC transporter substrate-binding protein [Microcoleaceae cyanobacterium]